MPILLGKDNRCLVLIAFAAAFSCCCPFEYQARGQTVKKPSVAGKFYPADAHVLAKALDSMLTDSVQGKAEDLIALIVPHAGYEFSGKTAAAGYNLLKGSGFKTAIIIGVAHRYPLSGIAVYPSGIFRTPLGDIEVDQVIVSAMTKRFSRIMALTRPFEDEHSVEVQLPFLQKVLPGCKIVPVLAGDCSYNDCLDLAALIGEQLAARKDIIVIVSTDMYHGEDWQEAEKIDNNTLSLILAAEHEGLWEKGRNGQAQLCGLPGVVTLLKLAADMGGKNVKLIAYTNSAQATGRRNKGEWTVGYSCVAISKKEPKGQSPAAAAVTEQKGANMLSNEHKRRLLAIARDTIKTYLKTGKKPDIEEKDPLLKEERGAFVTLHLAGELRGCIGNMIGTEPLYLTIRDMAVQSAFADPRFPSLSEDELERVEIEISVLSPLVKVSSPEQIIMGKHGVLVKKGFRSGVFLPQVATETGWSREEFLSNLCQHKAGLPADAWKSNSTDIFIFSADIFSEKEFRK